MARRLLRAMSCTEFSHCRHRKITDKGDFAVFLYGKHTLPVLRWLPFAILHREKAISDGKNSVFCSKLPYRAKIFLFQTGNFQITESIDGKDICGYDLRYTGSNLVGDLSQVTG